MGNLLMNMTGDNVCLGFGGIIDVDSWVLMRHIFLYLLFLFYPVSVDSSKCVLIKQIFGVIAFTYSTFILSKSGSLRKCMHSFLHG